MAKKEEIWMDIKGYEGYYMISSIGRIMSCKRTVPRGRSYSHIPEKIISNKFNGKYEFVKLSKEGVRQNILVHRLVGFHFIPNPKNKPCINHIDAIKTNNHYLNLEWCTNADNNLHSSVNNLIPGQTPNDIAVKVIELRRVKGLTYSKIAEILDINIWTAMSVCKKNKKFKDENYSKFRIR